MTSIFVIEVGKQYSKFENIAYLKKKDYCLIHVNNFLLYMGTALNDPYIAQKYLSMFLGITPIHANSIVQINKL